MPPYLIKSEIEQYAAEIEKEFKRLFEHRRLAVRPNTKQWSFFKHCFRVLMGEATGDFDCSKEKAVGYSHEVSAKLERDYYSRPLGEPVRFRFRLEDKSRQEKLLKGTAYSHCNDYLLLIIPTDPSLNTFQQMRDRLCRVIDDAIHAEFTVYNSLPRGDLTPLDGCFDADGPAYERILKSAEEHGKNGEIISNHGNPSTRPQLRGVELNEATESEARLRAVEYWNLHWFSTSQEVYVKLHQGQNRQRYTLIKRDHSWLVQRKNTVPRGRERIKSGSQVELRHKAAG